MAAAVVAVRGAAVGALALDRLAGLVDFRLVVVGELGFELVELLSELLEE